MSDITSDDAIKIKDFHKYTSKLSLFLKRNKLIVIMFLLSTIYFMYLNYIQLSWDFVTYVLNAQYLAGQSGYFELLRPPLVQFIMFILSFVGWHLMEYLFIFLISLLFAYSTTRLAKHLTINRTLFYALCLSPFLIFYALVNGSELLFLSFLILGVSFIIENNPLSGVWLGLSALARYNTLLYFPFLLLNKKRKTIIVSLVLGVLVFSSYLAYNFFVTGNMFSSIANLYTMNYIFREGIAQAPEIYPFLKVIGYYIVFFVIGLAVSIGRIILEIQKVKKTSRTNKFFPQSWVYLQKVKADLILLIILLLDIYTYFSIPLKSERYLFAMTLPIAYYSVLGIRFIIIFLKKRFSKMNVKKLYSIIVIVIFLLNISVAISLLLLTNHHKADQYDAIVKDIKELGISNCSLMTNSFVIMNYYGIDAIPYPSLLLIENRINDGENILLFYNVNEPEYRFNQSFLNSFPIILSKPDYIILGNKSTCIPPHDLDTPYLQERQNDVFELYGYYMNVDPCYLLSNKNEFLEKICNFVNLKGFILSPLRQVKVYE